MSTYNSTEDSRVFAFIEQTEIYKVNYWSFSSMRISSLNERDTKHFKVKAHMKSFFSIILKTDSLKALLIV